MVSTIGFPTSINPSMTQTDLEESFLTDEELDAVRQIREGMQQLGGIPTDIDTDFQLARWWRGHRKNMAEILSKMRLYIENRRVLGFDQADFLETFFDRPKTKQIMQYFAMSKVVDAKNKVTQNNGIVFVEGGEFDKNVVKVFTTGDYLEVFFGCCECVLQMILRQEKLTGKPSHGVCIFDMAGLEISHHVNPTSHANKVFKTRAQIWHDFYPDMMQKIIIVNPPYFLGVIWSIARFLLPHETQKLLTFCHKKDMIFQHLERDNVPKAYGGTWVDTTGYSNKPTCLNDRKEVCESDYYQPGTVWKILGTPLPVKLERADVKPGQTFRVPIEVERIDATLGWQFWLNGDVEFAVSYHPGGSSSESSGAEVTNGVCDAEGELVHPRLKIVTTKLAEEGNVRCHRSGTYSLEFHNMSAYFWIKLDYSTALA